ncbi:MAG: AraC family transcriptional regulator [Bacteroidales bacterium]|nr:AraC family transcriptional regulator [Bacteroidales bacterium]
MNRKFYILIAAISLIGVAFLCAAMASPKINVERYTTQSNEELMPIAMEFERANQLDSAFMIYSIMEGRLERGEKMSERDEKYAIVATMFMGNYYRDLYFTYDKSYHYLKRALELSRQYGLNKNISNICLNLGALKMDIASIEGSDKNSISEAWDLWTEGYQVGMGIGGYSYSDGCLCLLDLINIANDADRLAEIEPLIEQLDRYEDESYNSFFEYLKDYYGVLSAIQNKDFTAAQTSLDKIIDSGLTRDTPAGFALNLYMMQSYLAEAQNQYSQAISILTQPSVSELIEGEPVYRLEILDHLSNLYTKNGQNEKANATRVSYHELKEEIKRENKVRSTRELDFIEALDEALTQNLLKENKIKAQHRLLIYIGSFMLLVCGMLAIIGTLYVKLKHNYTALYLKDRQLRDSKEIITSIPPQSINEKEQSETEPKYQGSSLTDERKQKLLDKISAYMTTHQEIFSDKFSIEDLSEGIGEKRTEVSQVINELCGCNFPALLNHYRIQEACNRINYDPTFSSLTIEAMAANIGIKSRSYFARLFKAETGLNPSEYIRQAKQYRK